ncbi:hypothetical protein RvY_16203 [Ramazzottius varieornatus]|uniref:guanylate cyclase n=1 Tax=Ramazzottius varieornatus TaxID=947166 RepID=A0A1D1VYZ9_RAMVA|nr:hypothetical protein RvY_16203 [Ramazzottius varieornatus]
MEQSLYTLKRWIVLITVITCSVHYCGPQPATSNRFKLQVFYILNEKETIGDPNGILRSANIKPVLELARNQSNARNSFDIEWVETDFRGSPHVNTFSYCFDLRKPEQDYRALSAVLGGISSVVQHNQIHVIIAPPCRYEFQMAADLAAYLHIPIITGASETIPRMYDYPTAVTSNYSPMSIWAGFVAFCKKNNWLDVFIVYDDSAQDALTDPEERGNYANGLVRMLALRKINSTVTRHIQVGDVDLNLKLLKTLGGNDTHNASSDELTITAMEAIQVITVFDYQAAYAFRDEFEHKFNMAIDDTPITGYSAFYYDAVMLMAKSVDTLLKGNYSWIHEDISPTFFYKQDGKSGFTQDLIRTMTTPPWYDETDDIIGIVAGSTCALLAVLAAILARRRYTREKAASRSWMIKFEDVQYPRDVQEWLRRRYTIIDDGAGGLAVSEAVRMAKKAISGKDSGGKLAPDDEVRRTTLGPGRTISHKHGIVKSQPVTIRYCHKDLVPIVPRVLREAKLIRSLKPNDNIMQFVGASVEWKKVAIFYEYCSKGTLQDLLANTQLKLDWVMRISITTDILRGLAFIHQSPLEAHGRLTSKCCYIDARFVLKIGDHGLPSFFSLNADETEELKDTGDIWQMLLWTAPEHIGMMLGQSYVHKPTPTSEPLRISMLERTPGFWARCFKKNNSIYPGIIDREAYVATSLKMGTKQGDIYSFSIIFTEIITLGKPYGMYLPYMTAEEIVTKVRDRLSQVNPFRPDIRAEDCAHPEILYLLERCWNQSYNHRPSIIQVRAKMKDIGDDMGLSGKTASVMDIILTQMEEQAAILQATIVEKTKIMEAEKTKTFQLFSQILPRTIAERLRHEEVISAELYDIVTVLICDVENFGDIVAECTPTETIEFAGDLFSYYETNIAEFECINVDFYNTLVLVASGLPVRNGIFNAREIGRLALSLLFNTITFRPRHDTSERLKLKMAVHTGPVFAGIVGELNPRYSVFGETIFVTHRLLAVTKGFTIRCSASAQNLMETFGSFVLSRMDEIFIKGKGMQPTYQLFGENGSRSRQYGKRGARRKAFSAEMIQQQLAFQ